VRSKGRGIMHLGITFVILYKNLTRVPPCGGVRVAIPMGSHIYYIYIKKKKKIYIYNI
jgi:hypothetical protein